MAKLAGAVAALITFGLGLVLGLVLGKIGTAGAVAVIAGAALCLAVSIHETHATARNRDNAAVAAGAQELGRVQSASPTSSPPNV